jgi:prepilin-type N-terminal cleavage/methylation domain-containing protein
MKTRPARHAGFTLVEMAVVLLILTLLAGSLTVGLSSHLARRAEAATDEALSEARDALLGYVVRKGFFPCPAKSATDGAEDRDAGNCRKTVGLLPWAALGIQGVDGWSHRLRYAVTDTYARPISSMDDGKIEIMTRNIDGTELKLTTEGGKTPVVILSHGPNGLGAIDQDGNALVAPTAGTDEAKNASGDGKLFFSRTLSENSGTSGGAFDDRVTWLSPNLVAHRLITAGRLP